MPAKTRDYGFRTSVQITEDVEKLIQRARALHKKVIGYAPSRSAMIVMACRGFYRGSDWIESIKGGANGQ